MIIDETSTVALYEQLYQGIRHEIEMGIYPVGSKLPSIRGMASDMKLSRNTVEAGYRLLQQEGYVTSKQGSGYIVQDITYLHQNTAEAPAKIQPFDAPADVRFDFSYGNLEPGTFPVAAWRNITDDLLLSKQKVLCDSYSDPLGEPVLRSELARRLTSQRNVTCTPDQIVIQCSTSIAVQNLLLVLLDEKGSVAIEEPGYSGVRDVFKRCRIPVDLCCVENNYEHFLEDLERSHAEILYVTPSSQFPTCQVMPPQVREGILDWANRHDAYILEDDYCCDFHYRERRQSSLQSQDKSHRVIYMDTFSKSLSPALRMNYLVLPPAVLEKWKETFANTYSSVSWLSQATVARFLGDGYWERHLRRLQARNLHKYEALLGALERYMGDKVQVFESSTGLHVIVRVLDDRSEQELIDTARSASVCIYPTSGYWHGPQSDPHADILIGFSAIAEEEIEPGIAALTEAWFGSSES